MTIVKDYAVKLGRFFYSLFSFFGFQNSFAEIQPSLSLSNRYCFAAIVALLALFHPPGRANELQLWHGDTIIREGECSVETLDKWCDELAPRHYRRPDAEVTACVGDRLNDRVCDRPTRPWSGFGGHGTLYCDNGWTTCMAIFNRPLVGMWGTACPEGMKWNEYHHEPKCECQDGLVSVEDNGIPHCVRPFNEEKSYGNSCPSTSHPINYAIGNKYYIEMDYRQRGTYPIVFRRTYNSLDKGWRYSYGQFIEPKSETSVAVHRPDGQVLTFALKNGTWTPDPDVVTRLEGDATNGWTYHLRNNTEETYDGNGRLVAIIQPSGLQQTLTYNDAENQFTVTGPSGDWLTVTRNVSGKPLQLQDKAGKTLTYAYADNQLASVTYADGTSKQYLHEVTGKPWLITGIIDENGHRSHTVAYDDQGRAIMSELANGVERTDISYHDDGSVTLTNALGKKSHVEFKIIHGVKKVVHVDGEPTTTCQGTAIDYVYDDNGFLIKKVDPAGVVTEYTRDANGLALSRTEAAGTPEARTITTEWDTDKRLPLKVTEPNKITTYHYDANGLLLKKTVQER